MEGQNSFENNIEDNLLTYSQHDQQQQSEKVAYKGSKIKDLFPVNYFDEMTVFFERKQQYNPHFQYNTVIAQEASEINLEYEQLANKILMNNQYISQNQKLLNEDQILIAVSQYLQKIGLQNYVQVQFSTQCLSRTSVLYYQSRIVLKIRQPISYTKTSLEGTLNHQIGTHIVRYLNHKENSERKPSKKSKTFEEGLAAINQLLPQQNPKLFKAALRYNAVIHASKQSFVQVYKYLKKYIKDETDCWREAVRAKRGQINTQKPGSYHKDQNYLIGAVQILKNRKNIDFEKCFYSKLSAEEGRNIQKGVLPPFMDSEQKKKLYLKKIQAMALCNYIDQIKESNQD